MDIRKYFPSTRNDLGGKRKIEGAPPRNSRSSSPEPVIRRSLSPVADIKETTFDVPFEYDNFINVKSLGVGAFGSVSMVKDKRTGEKYALKYYKSNDYDGLSTGITGSFIDSLGGNRQEVDFLQRVDHPNIIRGLGAILTSSDARVKNNANPMKVINLGVVMELADASLTGFIKNNILSNEGILSLCYNILCGLNFIHENGYIHCDLKPDNILVKNFVAKIADPGYLINKNSVGNVMLTTNFCNPLLTRAPEFIGLHPLEKNERLYAIINSLSDGQRRNVLSWFDGYVAMLKGTKFYSDVLSIKDNSADIIKYIPVISLERGEFFSLGIILTQIYISPTDLEDIPLSFFYIIYRISSYAYEKRLASLRKLKIWPKGDDNIPGMDELLTKLLDGNPDTRMRHLSDVLSSEVFHNNSYTNFVTGHILVPKLNSVFSCSKFKEKDFLITMENMAIYASQNNMYMYNLSKSYALFHKILEYLATRKTEDKIKNYLQGYINAAGVMSLFLSVGRNDNGMPRFMLEDVYSNFRRYKAPIIDYKSFVTMMENVYLRFNGIVNYECTFDYGSSGNIDYRAIKYYTSCELMKKYKPLEYVVKIENEYIEYVAAKNERGEEIKKFPKNILVKNTYVKLRKLLFPKKDTL